MLRKVRKKLFDFYFSRRSEVCLDISQWAYERKIPKIEVHESAFASLLTAAGGNPRLEAGVYQHQDELIRPIQLLALENARVRDRIGVLELPDGRVVLEGNWSVGLLTETRTYRRRFDFKTMRTKGNVFSLLCLWGKEYYHWFYDVLPRLEASIGHLPADTQYLINENPHPYQLESLKVYGIGEDKLILQPSEVCHHIQTLWFATPAGHSGFSDPDLLRKVSQRMTSLSSFEEMLKKYYISRSKAKTRRVVNENELRSALRDFSIEFIRAEDLDFRAQLQLFANAQAILGPHGAGLANLLFLPPGSKCGEMFGVAPPTCYEMSAAALGVHFAGFEGEIAHAEIGDMSINPQKFAKWIEQEFQPVAGE